MEEGVFQAVWALDPVLLALMDIMDIFSRREGRSFMLMYIRLRRSFFGFSTAESNGSHPLGSLGERLFLTNILGLQAYSFIDIYE